MTKQEAIKILSAKRYCMKREDSGTDVDCNLKNCDECNLCYEQGTSGEQIEALSMAISALKAFSNCSELPNSSDLVSRSYLLAEYDRQHQGSPGGARKIIEEAPAVLRNSEVSESLKFEEIGKSVIAGFKSGIRNWLTNTEKDFEAVYSTQDFCSGDLISRQDTVDALESINFESSMDKGRAMVAVDMMPSAQDEQKKGKWIKKAGSDLWYCSECDLPSMHDWPYCERCGADMRKDNK